MCFRCFFGEDNKGGHTMKKSGGIVFAIILSVVLICAVILYATGTFGGTKQQAVEEAKVVATAQGCNYAPTWSVTAKDTLNTGSSVSVDKTVIVNGAFAGGFPSTFTGGDKVRVLMNATNFISVWTDEYTIACTNPSLSVNMYATDDPTLLIYPSTGGEVIGNSVTASCVTHAGRNQSSSSSTISVPVTIQSAGLQSSGELVMVVEVANNTEVSDNGIKVTGTGVTAYTGKLPSEYTNNATNSARAVFNLPASVAGDTKSFSIQLTPESGKTIGGGSLETYAKVTLYSKQAFVEDDGSAGYGIATSKGVNKYEDTQTYGICIV
jgi:hypothetical protein